LDQAVAVLEKAIAPDPLDALSYRASGRTLAEAARRKKGKPATDLTKEAVKKLTKAREIAPRGGGVLCGLAHTARTFCSSSYRRAKDAGWMRYVCDIE